MPPAPSIAFFFSIYDDLPLCLRLVQQIRRLYSAETIVSISDGSLAGLGGWRDRWVEFCQRYEVTFIETSQRLKFPRYGGLWLHRLFEHALARTTADILIKLEGDTQLWRQFRSFPDADVAGTLSEQSPPFPRGGCVMWRRETLKHLIETAALLDPRYCDSYWGYGRYGKWRWGGETEDHQPILCADRVLGDVIEKMQLTLANWNEVDIQFREKPGYGYAATHPHRLAAGLEDLNPSRSTPPEL